MADMVMAMRAVADRLDQTGLAYAFVGGAIVPLLLDHPELSEARPTDDVDVILSVAANMRYSAVEEMMRRLKFDHDMSEGAPKCRWLLGRMLVDIMPTDGTEMGLKPKGFPEALATAEERTIRGDVRLRLITAPAFLALKLEAFADRGKKDYLGSHDLEDLLTVIDGRERIIEETQATSKALRQCIRDGIRALNGITDFQDSLARALAPDDASQERLPALRRKLAHLAALE